MRAHRPPTLTILKVSCVPSKSIDPEAMRSLVSPESRCATYQERLEARCRRPDTAHLLDILLRLKYAIHTGMDRQSVTLYPLGSLRASVLAAMAKQNIVSKSMFYNGIRAAIERTTHARYSSASASISTR